MAMTDTHGREAQTIEELLPWYEKGTLGPADMRRFDDYLRTHPEMQFQLGLIREELAETVAANERLGMPSSAARERLFAVIAAEPAGAPRAGSSFKSWWASLLPDGVSPRLGLAALAACAIIVEQAAMLIAYTVGRPDGGYRVAAGGDTATAQPGSYVFVRFTDEARSSDITAILQEFKAVIVDGPKPGGVFKIRVSPHALTDEERVTVIEKLREKTGIIGFVAPAG